MKSIVQVELGHRSYPVHIGEGLLDSLGELARAGGKRCAVITDSNVAPLYGERALEALSKDGLQPVLITVPAGESSKSIPVAENICNEMIAAGLDRKASVIALGGGVVGDLAGFVAAIYYRGIPFIQVPTTIIAQVDSAVGGKTGVNTVKGKNLLGCFHQPRMVVADTDTLQTLPDREFNEGFAEIIKHAIIRDRDLFGQLGAFERSQPIGGLIRRNVEIKAAIVAADEFETTGERALLNFGHTIGHAIENAAGYGTYLHGEAISLGMVAATRLSQQNAGLSQEEGKAIEALLARHSLPVRLTKKIDVQSIVDSLMTDKKFSEGQIRFVLTPKIGEAFVSPDVSLEDIRNAIRGLEA